MNTTLISIVCKGKREKGFRVIKNPDKLRFLFYKIFLHTKCGDSTWRVSDCEELGGGLLTGDDGVVFGDT